MFRNLSFRVSFLLNVGISLVFAGAAMFAIYQINSIMRGYALTEAEDKARILLDHNLAIHSYFSHELKPALFELTDGYLSEDYFDPVWMSSTYVVRGITGYFSDLNPEAYYYKESAINARSPQNDADAFESAFLDQLRDDPELVDQSLVRVLEGEPYFVTIRRGESMDPSCLRCHDTPERAPQELVDFFGGERSFGREAGDVVSAISIRIPLGDAYGYADQVSARLSGIFLVLLSGLFITQYLGYWYLVFKPLSAIREKTTQITRNEARLGEQIPIPVGSELRELTDSFNTMSLSLRQNHDLLEKRVATRTMDLKQANEKLEQEISERRQIEAALWEHQHHLKEAQTLAHLGHWRIVIATKSVSGSDEFFRIIGLDKDTVTLDSIIHIVHPEDREDFLTAVRKGVAQGLGWDSEHRLLLDDGTVKDIHLKGEVLINQDGQPVEIQGTLQDITRRKQTEQERLELELERERIQILTNFITQASHEFKTPLATINTSAYLLKKPADEAKREKQIQRIEDQVQDITELINSLMMMAQLDGLRTLPTGDVNLNDLIEEIITKKQAALESKNLQNTVELKTTPLLVQGSAEYLKMAIEHIVDNAIHFTPSGGQIRIQAEQLDGTVALHVIDTGNGIAASELLHIFERFYRVDKSGKFRGFGLGLSIAKAIIELHQGKIEVESEVGKGSTFRVILPTV